MLRICAVVLALLLIAGVCLATVKGGGRVGVGTGTVTRTSGSYPSETGAHRLYIDGATNYLLIDGNNNFLKIDGV